MLISNECYASESRLDEFFKVEHSILAQTIQLIGKLQYFNILKSHLSQNIFYSLKLDPPRPLVFFW